MSSFLTKRREPLEFMLWLGIFGSVIFFAFILFVFVQKEWNAVEIPIRVPVEFWLSSGVILVSSFCLFRAKQLLQQQEFANFRWYIAVSYLLGLAFMTFQLMGWTRLFAGGITLSNSTGGAFTYILSGLHILHTLGGVIALTFLLRDAFRRTSYIDSFVFSVNPPNILRLRLVSIYWHFLDVLWLVIFLFLLYHAAQNAGTGS